MRTASLTLISLFALAMFAGCLDSDSANEGEDQSPEAVGHPVWVHDGMGNSLDASAFMGEIPAFTQINVTDRISGEPTIGVTRAGTVLYPAIDFDAQLPPGNPRTVYFASSDNGTTWNDVSPQIAGVETHPYSGDPYVYVDPTTGRMFALDMGPSVACNKVSWSDDEGATWLTREGACPLPVADHPSLFAAPKVGPAGAATPLYPNNLFLCTNQVADVQCSMSPDGGLNWLPSVPVFVGIDVEALTDPLGFQWLCGSLTGHGHASFVDGTVYIGRGYCGVPMAGVSQDGGTTWETVVISEDPEHMLAFGHDVSIGSDLAGNAYAFWIGNGDTSAYLSVSMDQGRTWGPVQNVTAPGVTAAKFPSLVAGADGRIAFQYLATTTPSGWALESDSSDEEMQDEWRAATWNAYVSISLDATAENPVFATTTVNDVNEPLKRGTCEGRCFGDKGGMYDFLDIDIDPMTGRVWTALVDVCTGDCDLPDADAETDEITFGAVGRQDAGTLLLVEAFPEA